MTMESTMNDNGNGIMNRMEVTTQPAKSRAKRSKKASAPRRAARKFRWTASKRIACAVGSVGCSLLILSVHHCTEAITLLTGSHWFLAALLAIGIDAGMVASELAELFTHDHKAKRWSSIYVGAAVVLSMVLNAYAFSLHAAPGMAWASMILGIVIPALVYCTGKIAGNLWQE